MQKTINADLGSSGDTQPVELFCSSCRDGVCPVPYSCGVPAEQVKSIKFLAALTALLRTTKGNSHE